MFTQGAVLFLLESV